MCASAEVGLWYTVYESEAPYSAKLQCIVCPDTYQSRPAYFFFPCCPLWTTTLTPPNGFNAEADQCLLLTLNDVCNYSRRIDRKTYKACTITCTNVAAANLHNEGVKLF